MTHAAQGRKILLVDDDTEVREILAELFEERGTPIETASNGAEALTKLRAAAGSFSVVLLDLMMPVMDGWALRAAMLQDDRFASLPVVILSGAADIQSSVSTLRAARVIRKPLRFDALLDVIRELHEETK